MNVVFDIATSMEFWRRIYPANRTLRPPAPYVLDCRNDCAVHKGSLLKLLPDWVTTEFLEPIGGRIHVLSFDHDQRRETSVHVASAWTGKIPEGSFYQLQPNVFVMSPSFMFLRAAHLLSRCELIAFGDELCGFYSFDATEERGFRKRKTPLVTVAALERYLSSAEGCYGAADARNALVHLVDGSASPMETFDEMALCLPYRLGGYGLPKPFMNHPIPLDSRAKRIAKRDTCYGDMCYPAVSLDIEYHGKLDHSSLEDRASDRARVNGLKEMGFEVIELTADQVGDLFAFEYIIERIAKLIGKRVKKSGLGATPARLLLRSEVYAWNRSYGRMFGGRELRK